MLHEQRIGHAGTLDPMATGVLVVCVGQATRVVDYLMGAPKQYRAEVLLGTTTTTDDLAGDIITSADCSAISRADVEALIPGFVGRILQRPPVYSALKVDGRPLYRLARQGRAPEPAEREVDVYALMVTDWSPPRFGLLVDCGRGTYVRSIARDIGAALGVGGCIAALERTRVGKYRLEDSSGLDEIARRVEAGEIARILRPIDEVLADLQGVWVDAEGERRLTSGATWHVPSSPFSALPMHAVEREEGGSLPAGEAPLAPRQEALSVETTRRCRVYSTDGRLIAIAHFEPASGLLRPVTTFRSMPAEPDYRLGGKE